MNAIIAVNPQQMQEAQSQTMEWVDAKLAAAQRERDNADTIFEQLAVRGMKQDAAKALLDKAAKRVMFYEKVKAALAAGYYIIPPFNIQLFAIRTDRVHPNKNRSDVARGGWNQEQSPRLLPVGAGRYVDPQPNRYAVGTEQRPAYNDPNKTRDVSIYENREFRDEIDLPVRALKPQIIEEVGRALELKIFDALGIAPAYRAADPIIAGQLIRPEDKGVLTFLVTWWLESGDI